MFFLRPTETGLARKCLRNYRRFGRTFLLPLPSAFEFLHSQDPKRSSVLASPRPESHRVVWGRVFPEKQSAWPKSALKGGAQQIRPQRHRRSTLPSSVMYGGRIDQIAAQRAQPCWGAVVVGARAVLRPISWARRGNGLNQTLAQTEIEQLDVRIDAEL
jgi:hypothetical protein